MILGNKQLDALLLIAKEAGAGILEVYNSDNFDITVKDDKSPLTLADRISHDIILKGLTKLTPQIPVISEEGKDIAYETRKNWECYWCVDPLDGTKEFIKRNGEFTVNIALMQNNCPVLGVIYVPVTGELYYGGAEIGSWKETAAGEKKQIYADKSAAEWISVGSRSHASAEETELLAQYPVSATISVGSSIKFCLIAEGKAHIYYRHGPTMEWDTAAGQAIAVYSGAVMTKPDGQLFEYNKPSLLNGSFLVKVK
ncbi:3'(2'),5'-bisphosphate nucleotidase CysQ [Mucilaginibacter sp. FT3.2]|uniref:3'(2'),5'-bisphosphate nucleotidase CysQ n=1 Tax=Mucilaginibacter sp. FT3.2 TaxID=2723090 RepID=UPI001613B8CB|nr:3'(2'),5'-bisphosphate nucleotidase CysQ [Mucilaginibacter sp. FT3.2]MBB6229816.1 3'(2'), 5'-bisphosphate nucleotidase [Mucilaginibacter sp. FT3.2]